MPTPDELKAKLLKSLKSDMVMMVGAVGSADAHVRPMTGQFDERTGDSTIWFFSAKDTHLVQAIGNGSTQAHATFASKSHDIFACIHGTMRIDNDRAVIDRLWNRFVATWYEKGKDDPSLALIRLDTSNAEVWENASSLVAGIQMLLGLDPKVEFKDKTAQVKL